MIESNLVRDDQYGKVFEVEGKYFRVLTPHNLDVYTDTSGETLMVSVPASGTIARLDTTIDEMEPTGGIFSSKVSYGDVVGLPPEEDGVHNVVALPVALKVIATAVAKGESPRGDLALPDSGRGAVRKNGSVIGTTGIIFPMAL
jgi:hypothetical protein